MAETFIAVFNVQDSGPSSAFLESKVNDPTGGEPIVNEKYETQTPASTKKVFLESSEGGNKPTTVSTSAIKMGEYVELEAENVAEAQKAIRELFGGSTSEVVVVKVAAWKIS